MKVNRGFLILCGVFILSFPVKVHAEDATTLKTLNKLIETARDSELGYQAAAKDTADDELRSKFQEISRQRGRFAYDLVQQMKQMGGEPDSRGSLGAAIHRKWIRVRSAMTGSNEESIINEVASGESVAVEAYEEALQKELSTPVRSLVNQQAEQVRRTYQEIRNLENKIEYKKSVEQHDEKNPGENERQAAGAAAAAISPIPVEKSARP